MPDRREYILDKIRYWETQLRNQDMDFRPQNSNEYYNRRATWQRHTTREGRERRRNYGY